MGEQKNRLKVVALNICYIFMLMVSLNYRPVETSYPSMLVAFPGWVMVLLYCCFYLDLIPLVVFNFLLMKLESSKVQFIR